MSYPDTELTPRNDAFPAWDDVPDHLKVLYAHQMEVYAGYSENVDYNVGRIIDAIEELGELDNTLIIWVWGDNGASMEGTITGSFNELTMQYGIPLTDEMQLQLLERYGGAEAWSTSMMAPHYGAAWAWAGNTPFQWGKQVGSLWRQDSRRGRRHEGSRGNLSVEQTDHMVKEGATGLASVGFVVGLFAPPLLAATAIGAALGAVGGKALHGRTGSKIEESVGETIPIGGAGLIVAYDRKVAEQVEAAVKRAVQRVVGEAEGRHVEALKGAIADAQAKMT